MRVQKVAKLLSLTRNKTLWPDLVRQQPGLCIESLSTDDKKTFPPPVGMKETAPCSQEASILQE